MASVAYAEQPGTPGIPMTDAAHCAFCRFEVLDGAPTVIHHVPEVHRFNPPPPPLPCGTESTRGRRAHMEDYGKVVTDFVKLRIEYHVGECIVPEVVLAQNGRRTSSSGSPRFPLLDSTYGELPGGSSRMQLGDTTMMDSSGSSSDDMTIWSESSQDTMDNETFWSHFHYAAVFDGHGGAAVSNFLYNALHEELKQKLENMHKARSALTLNELADGLRKSFLVADSKLGDEAKTAGSTGVVSMISQSHVVIANCGDSRAVLCRRQQPFRLSRDQKPTQPDEQERIARAGGRVCNYNGVRVMGLLAMTRAFGDHCLSNFGITAEPEITIIERENDDQFVILASDGLWDVVSDTEACELTTRCFKRAQERNASKGAAAQVAASVLMRVALDKGSSDNITVVVVDLRPAP